MIFKENCLWWRTVIVESNYKFIIIKISVRNLICLITKVINLSKEQIQILEIELQVAGIQGEKSLDKEKGGHQSQLCEMKEKHNHLLDDIKKKLQELSVRISQSLCLCV